MNGVRIEWDEAGLRNVVKGSLILKASMQVKGDWQAIKCRKQLLSTVDASRTTAKERRNLHGHLNGECFTCDVRQVDAINGWPVAIIRPTNRIVYNVCSRNNIIHW